MQAYCIMGEDGRVTAISYDFHCGDGEIIVEVPEGVDLTEGPMLRVVDGVVQVEPTPVSAPAPTIEERLSALEFAQLETMLLSLGGDA